MVAKSPIIDSIVEITFSSNIPSQALVGILYQAFETDFSGIENLPILQVPLELRQKNPDLMKQPNYRLAGERFTVAIGDGVLFIGCVIDRAKKFYPGWDVFGAFANKIIQFLIKNKFIVSVNRTGVRYVNFFEEKGLADKTNLSVKVASTELKHTNMNVFYESEDNEKKLKIQLAGEANVNSPYFGNTKGAIIDISAFQEQSLDLPELKGVIDKLHDYAETTFFEIVKAKSLPEGVTKRAR